MKAIVGLGNVGDRYRQTRHNVGFLALDKLAQIYNLQFSIYKKLHSEIAKNDELILAKPVTMMNSSGLAVKEITDHRSLITDHLYIVHDDLDLRLGEYKIQFGKGPKIHNGVNSIEESLGSSEFWRVRIGVDNRDPKNRTPGDVYVLQNFRSEEMEIIEDVIAKAIMELKDNI